jgi:sugar/nucleoside kinase (ribokinase family)
VDPETRRVRPGGWLEPGADLAGVQVVFVSDADLGRDSSRARALLAHVPIVLLTLGRRGAELITRDGGRSIAVRPSQETDATGAGDVFAAAFLIGYAETGDAAEAAAFACCAAACAVEAPGTSGLADRAEVERRLALRRRWLQNGDNR